MSLILNKTQALFLHLPKTGGTFIKKVFKELGIKTHENFIVPDKVAKFHAYPHQIKYNYNYSFVFVRHPVSWYESFWKFTLPKIQKGPKRWWIPSWVNSEWHCLREIEDCVSDNFQEFISNIIKSNPGYLTRVYENFVGPAAHHYVDFVGKNENLAQDLLKVLNHLEYDVSLKDITSIEKQNVSEGPKPEWRESDKEKIMYLEQGILKRFYQ